MLRLLAVAGLLTAACGDDALPVWNGEPFGLRVVSQNVAGGTTLVADPDRGATLAAHLGAAAPDFILVQECDPCDDLLAMLPSDYQLAAPPAGGVAVIHDDTRWWYHDGGALELGGDDDGWGARYALWGRYVHRDTGLLLGVYSTHYCVPIRDADDACDTDRQLEYTDRILAHLERGGPSVLGGDFNVFDRFADGPVVGRIEQDGLVDTLEGLDPESGAITFQGNSWAPPGRIDYVFATGDVGVGAAAIDTSIPPGEGSDHYAVSADLAFE